MKLLIASLILITFGCRSTHELVLPNYVLPPKPQREEIEPVPDNEDLVTWKKWFSGVFIYYEELVQKWELWGYTVESIINPLPD